MRSFVRRPVWAAVLTSVVALATIGASCTTGPAGTPQPPEQPVFDWQAKATTIHIVDDNDDNFGCDVLDVNCDEPYLFHLAFRVQYGVPGSADAWVVHDRPNEIKCPGAPPSGFLAQVDSCKSGESAPVPAAQGVIDFPALKGSDFVNVLFGQLPEIAGVITFAFEEDILSNGTPNTAPLETLIEDLLNDIIADGNIPESSGEDAATAIVGDIIDLFGSFLTNTAVNLITDVGLFDDFVGLAPTVIAGVTGGLAGLVESVNIDGQTFQQVPVLNGNVFTTAAPASFTTTYTLQTVDVPSLGTVDIGAGDTRYDVDWMVGQP